MIRPFVQRLGAVGARAVLIGLFMGLTASAQMTAPLGERLLVSRPSTARWLGDVSACGGPLCAQTASGEFSLPVRDALQLLIGGGAGRTFDSRESWLSERRVDLRYATGTMSAWAGAVRADGRSFDTTALRSRLESGIRFGTSSAEIAFSVSAGRRTSEASRIVTGGRDPAGSDTATSNDTTPGARTRDLVSIAELRASWSVGRFLLSTVAGRGAALRSSPVVWGSLEAATTVHHGPLAFLNAGFAASPGFAGFIGIPRRSVSVGLRFSSATFASRAADRSSIDAATGAFAVKRESSGRYRLRIRIPSARVVELASDCTDWKAVELSRGDGGEWEVVLPVSAGAHLVNIRVDGGAWVAPPGLVAKMDDFAGAVGVFVVD